MKVCFVSPLLCGQYFVADMKTASKGVDGAVKPTSSEWEHHCGQFVASMLPVAGFDHPASCHVENGKSTSE